MSFYLQGSKKQCFCSSFVQLFDFLSFAPKWYLHTQSSITTNFGGVMSIIIIMLTIVTTINSFIDFIQAENGTFSVRQIFQSGSVRLPMTENFDVIILIDKTSIINWDSQYKKIDFGFYFNEDNRRLFQLCDNEMYNLLSINDKTHSLLCFDNSTDSQINIAPKFYIEHSSSRRLQNENFNLPHEKPEEPPSFFPIENEDESPPLNEEDPPINDDDVVNSIPVDTADTAVYEVIAELENLKFESPSFYMRPKCLSSCGCEYNDYKEYYDFISSINQINLILKSKRNNKKNLNTLIKDDSSVEIMEMNGEAQMEIVFKKITVKENYSILPFFFHSKYFDFFTLEKSKSKLQNGSRAMFRNLHKFPLTHQTYKFYLSELSDYVVFERESIDVLFSKIVGSFYIYYCVFYFISSISSKFYQEVFLFNQIGRHAFYDDTASTQTSAVHSPMNDNGQRSKRMDTLYFYNKKDYCGSGVVNSVTKTSNPLMNLSNSSGHNFKLINKAKVKTDIKVLPLKSKNYFSKMNKKPMSITLSCRKKIKFFCLSDTPHFTISTKGRYLYLLQSFFELGTYLSLAFEILKLKNIVLNRKPENNKSENLIFNNILMSKQYLEEELIIMNSPEKVILPPNEILPLSMNSELAKTFLLK